MKQLANYWGRFLKLRNRLGTLGAFKKAGSKLLRALRRPKADLLGHYAFVSQPEFGLDGNGQTSATSVLWFVPDFQIGSGGHLNIFRLVAHLDQLGFQNTIAIVGGSQFTHPKHAQECIVKNFAPIQGRVVIGIENLPAARFAMATSWTSAYYVRAFRGAVHKGYFVQDFEPWFYPAGTEAQFAENTYRFGFFGITAGNWLADKLLQDYGMQTSPMGFSVDHTTYFSTEHSTGGPPTVFFYARPPTPRRAFELGILALAEVAKKVPNLKVIMAGWNVRNYKIPFEYRNDGVLSLSELPDVYRHCQAALVISCSNLSLLPLEIMACGCPVVSNKGPQVEWLLNSGNAVLTEPSIEGLAEGLIKLIRDEGFRREIRAEAIQTAQQTSWKVEAERVAKILEIRSQVERG